MPSKFPTKPDQDCYSRAYFCFGSLIMNLNISVKPGSLNATGLGAMGSCGEGNRNTGTLTIPVAIWDNGYPRQRNEREVRGFRIGS